MQRTFTLKSLAVLAVLALGAGCANARDSQSSFEDGLKNKQSPLEAELGLVHGSAQEYRFIALLAQVERDLGKRFEQGSDSHSEQRFEQYLDGKHAFEMGEDHHHGKGINVSPVSEPTTDAMLLTGLLTLAALLRRKSKPAQGSLALAA